MKFLCIEILGECAFHKFLIQSGWSGKDYLFFYNAATGSHLRAYRCVEDYYAERVDLHRRSEIWSLVANLLPEDQIDPAAFIGPAHEPPREEETTTPAPRGRKGRL